MAPSQSSLKVLKQLVIEKLLTIIGDLAVERQRQERADQPGRTPVPHRE
jgi:hypothetical protein